MSKPVPHQEETADQQATLMQCAQFWKVAADTIATLVKQAHYYLPESEDGMDPDTAAEILSAGVQFRVSADTAFGTYSRTSSAEREQAARRVGDHQQRQMNGTQPAVPRAY